MATYPSGMARIWIRVLGPALMLAILAADHWLPSTSSTPDLELVLLGLVALVAWFAGLTSALVTGGLLLAAEIYSVTLSGGINALTAQNGTHLLSLLLAVLLIAVPCARRASASASSQESPSEPAESRSAGIRRVDVVTGLLTRPIAMSMVQHEWDRWRRFATPFSLLLIEVEGFESMRRSDPAQADARLRIAANRMTASLRSMDLASRVDDGRFLILLPQTHEAGSMVAGRKLLKAVRQACMDESGDNSNLDLRIGAASVRRSDDRLQDLLQRAEEALRHARRSGTEGIAGSDPALSQTSPN